MTYDRNPFSAADTDRHDLWEMLVRRDIDAFLSRDWSMVDGDFAADRFFGMHGHFRSNPDSWRLDFPTIDAYRDEWLRQAEASSKVEFAEPLHDALFRLTNMRDIDLQDDRAVLHKKFDGSIAKADGTADHLKWQTLYFCHRIEGRWKIAGFVGYLPFPLA